MLHSSVTIDPEVVQVHPPPEPTACSEQTTNRVNETTVNKEARPVPSSTAAVNISSQSSTDLHQSMYIDSNVLLLQCKLNAIIDDCFLFELKI